MRYQEKFQEAKAAYDMLETFDVNASVTALDRALYNYSNSKSAEDLATLQAAFSPIGVYYSELASINSNLQDFLDKASNDLVKLKTSEERYNDKIHPEESIKSREIMFGIFPNLRVESIPYILAASVFMASLAIFLIFQMIGFTGQMNLPPALVAWWITRSVGPPFYRNPMVLGGVSIILMIALIVFIVLYYKKQ